MLQRFEVPWWTRAPLAAALGGLIGLIMAFAGRGATPTALLYAVLPTVAAGNVILSDLGRRRLSIAGTFGWAIGMLVLVGLLGQIGAALAAILLGGSLAARLAQPGRFLDTRRGLMFLIGAAACPGATLGAYHLVQRTQPGEPLAIGLALFHVLFWLPAAGAEAALAWSAARARARVPAPAPRLPDLEGPDGLREDGSV